MKAEKRESEADEQAAKATEDLQEAITNALSSAMNGIGLGHDELAGLLQEYLNGLAESALGRVVARLYARFTGANETSDQDSAGSDRPDAPGTGGVVATPTGSVEVADLINPQLDDLQPTVDLHLGVQAVLEGFAEPPLTRDDGTAGLFVSTLQASDAVQAAYRVYVAVEPDSPGAEGSGDGTDDGTDGDGFHLPDE